MHFVDPDKIEDYSNGKTPQVIQNHDKVAGHYDIPVINLALEVTERIRNGEFNWEDDFRDLHPSPFGQGVYARSMIKFLEDAFSANVNTDAQVTDFKIPDKLDNYSYDKGHLIDITKSNPVNGWHLDPLWIPDDNAGVRSNYHNVPMLVSNQSGSLLKFRFKAKAIGIAVAAGPDAGIIEYRIDEGKWQHLNLFTQWSMHLHLPWYFTLSAELPVKEHILELRTAQLKDERSMGYSCRIRYFFINEN
jgi:sialidase-1